MTQQLASERLASQDFGQGNKSEIKDIYDSLGFMDYSGGARPKPTFDQINDEIGVGEYGDYVVFTGDMNLSNELEPGTIGEAFQLTPAEKTGMKKKAWKDMDGQSLAIGDTVQFVGLEGYNDKQGVIDPDTPASGEIIEILIDGELVGFYPEDVRKIA